MGPAALGRGRDILTPIRSENLPAEKRGENSWKMWQNTLAKREFPFYNERAIH